MTAVSCDHSCLVDAVAAMDVANSPTTLPVVNTKQKGSESRGIDSGYASQISTPNSSKSGLVDSAVTDGKNLWPRFFQKPKQLRPYNKPVSQLTWDRFSDLREQYADILNNFTRNLPNCPSVLMTLQVLGEDEETAKPWVFVQCDKAVFKKINNFFKQPVVKIDFEPPQPDDRSPLLRVLVHPRKPRLLGIHEGCSSQHDVLTDGDLIEIFADKGSISAGDLSGIPIMSEHSQRIHKATLGGIVVVTDKKGQRTLFGMTAGHFLQQQPYDLSEDELSDDVDDEFHAEESFELDPSSIEVKVEEEKEALPVGGSEDEHGRKADLNKWSKLGRLSKASHTCLEDGRNFDWALMTIDESHPVFLPTMPFYNSYQSRDLGFSAPETNVMAVFARGLKRGTLSSSLSYIMLPPGKVLVGTYLLSFSDGESK